MIYTISKRSESISETKPCKYSYKQRVRIKDQRTVSHKDCIKRDSSSNPTSWYRWWFTDLSYFDHGENSIGIYRYSWEECWVIKIKTLKDLHKLIDEVGEVCLSEEEIQIMDEWG